MAELTLTKIENGMKDGGTAIGGNFDAVKAAVDAQRATEPVKLTPVDGVVISPESPLRVWRIGKTVFLGGAVSVNPASGANLTTIPVGYRPDEKVGFMADVQQNPIVGAAFQVDTDGTVLCVYHANSNSLTFYDGITWQTNDDFPD